LSRPFNPSIAAGLVALGVALTPLASAQEPGLPDWSGSTLTCPATVRERDLMTCTLTVRRGEADRFSEEAGTDWTVTLPPKALLAEAGADVAFDAENRMLRGQVTAAPGGAAIEQITLIAGPDTDGTQFTVRVTIAGAEPTYLVQTTAVEARRREGELIPLGPVSVSRAGVWVLGFLATGPLFLGGCAYLAGRLSAMGFAAAAWAAMGFLLAFAGLAREDARVLTDYVEAECTVTDAGRHSRTSGSGRHATQISEPFVAVRFDVKGSPVFGTGFDSGSHLRRGGSSWPTSQLANFGSGARAPCWYDPEDPARIVVVRGPGGAYLFALLPLGLLALVIRPLWKSVSNGVKARRAQPFPE